MIMLGSANDDAYGRLVRGARSGGARTRSARASSSTTRAWCTTRAVEAGAEIVWPLESPEYGGVFFACRDPEGHIWNVGSYDPWAVPE